jgi:hypothetical protein
MFDGTLIPKNGKFMAIMDANYIEGIDDATKSRLFDEIKELKRFEKPEEFSELMQRLLTKGTSGITLDDKAWQDVGEYVLSTPLSNRETVHIIKQLRRGTLEAKEEMLDWTYDQLVQYRNQQLQAITKDTIIGKFDEYIRTRMEIERKSEESMRKDDTKRFKEFLNMQAPQTTA